MAQMARSNNAARSSPLLGPARRRCGPRKTKVDVAFYCIQWALSLLLFGSSQLYRLQ